MVNTATSNEQHHHHHEHEQHVEQQNLLHHPEPLNDPSGILSNSPNFASVNGIQIFEPIYQPNIAEKNLKVASVTLPNGHKRDFHIHKNSKGNILFDLAAESETLLEKDYFGLRYEDELGEMTWLYPDKRIQKQLKHKPWNFVFQIKFYPPEPSALADDLTRYLLYLQIRKEIYEGKLPASYAKQILLAAMVMQAEIGDFEAIKQSPNDYERFLREQHLIPQIDEEVLTKVREAHREQKGLTPNEAHQKYLDTAKDLAKYGFTFFNAKGTKNGPVIIGIYAHGICVYKDQLQIHRFLWQGVNKIQFRGNKFSVVLKPGELDPKKEVTVNYRLTDYATAKKLYRTAVEHHTFFRLIKPEDKPKGTFLRRWGSDRFRYQGRTYFQAKMASQMFDHPSQVVTIQRTSSGRQVSRSVDDLAQQPRSFPTSPMHYVDETTQQLTSPEKSKSYSLSTSKADKAKKKAEELSPLSVVVQQQQSQQRQHKSKRNSMSSTSSSESESSTRSVSMASPNSGEYYVRSSYTPQQKSTISPYEEVIFPLSISKEERQQQYQTPVQHSTSNRNSRVRFSSDTKPVTPDDGSAVAMAPAVKPGKRNAKRRLFGPVNDDHTAFSPVDDLYKAPEISSVPLDSRVTLYDKGWYTTTSSSSATRALSPTNFFVGCCKPPRRTLVSERLLRNRQSLPSSSEYSIIKRAEIEPHPIRYFVEVYHSGKPQIETKRKQRFMARKDVDFVNPNELNRGYYNFPKDVCYDWDRTECSRDPEPLPLKQFSTIYWFGGNSKQGNAKPVGIKGQNIIVSSDVQQGEGERIIITEASTSQQSVATKEEEPRVVEIIEEKPVITVRQEEGKTVTTIETTTVITTTENFKSGSSEVVNEESLPIQSSTPLPIESVQDIAPIPPIESEQVTVIETTPKSEELDAVPIKKYSNVYHSGTSLENTSPMEWVKKKRGILFIKKSSSTKSQTSSSTVEEPQPSTSKETTPESLLGKRKKSSSTEPVVAKIAHTVSERARTFSLSKHYPEVSKPFEGQLKEIHRNPEAPSANLFDCVSFVEEESITDEPKTKKAKPSRAARFCLACVGGNRQRGTEKKASKEIESSQDPRLTTEGGIHVEDVYTYEPTNVTEIHETVETVTKTEKKKYDKIPEVIVTHDLSLIPATSEEEIQQTLPLQIEVERSDLSQHVETIPAGTSYQEPEEDTKTTKSVIIPPTPTPNEATYVEEYTSETSVQKSEPQKAMELTGYPSVIESYRIEVDISNKNDEAPHENILIEEAPISTQLQENEKLWVSTVTREHRTVTKEKLVSSVASAPQTFTEKTVKEETMPIKTISKRTKMLAEKKHYPLIGTSSEGHVSELQRKEDFKESNLFDTISFISDSDDSGLGADSGSKRKSGGLICIPKSKKSKKTKTSEIEKINYTEVQANRNKKVKRARLFSFSKDYPEIGGEIYEGELKELKPIQEAKFTNLFDEINFAPDEQSVETVKQENVTKSKTSGLWCVPTAKKQKRTTSIASVKSEEIVDTKIIETYSMSKYYPEVGVSYEGELSEITPAKDSAQINIFDSINFLPKEEKIEVVTIEKEPQIITQEMKTTRSLWCGPTSKKRTTSVTSEESIKKGTLNALQIARNKAVEKARTFSFSKDYPEIGGEIYEGELNELAPVKQPQFTNLFDEINFASDEQSVKIKVVKHQKQLKPKKDTNFICMKKSKRKTSESSSVSSLSLQDHKNLNAMQIARNKIVRRTRYFSTSKHYPEIGVPTEESELIELKPVEQAQFTNLFDEIDFASDEIENINVEKSKIFKAKKHKKSNLLCATKSKRKTSEVSSTSNGTSVSSISLKDHKNLNAMQIARNKIVRRARYFSTSKHYPEIGVPTEETELIELKPVEQAPFAKLFDEISFASSEDLEVKEVIPQKVTKKSRGLPNCLACTGFKSKPKEITEETDEFAYERHTVPQDIVHVEEHITVPSEEILAEYVEEPIIEIIEKPAIKVTDETVVRNVEEINVTKDFSQEIHEQTYNEEFVEIGLPIRNINEAKEYTETTINVSPAKVIVETTLDEPVQVIEEVTPQPISEETIDEYTNYPKGYPKLSEPFVGDVSQLNYQSQVSETAYIKEEQEQKNIIFKSSNPNLLIIHHEQPQKSAETIQQEEQWLIGYPQSVEEQVKSQQDELIHSEMAFKSQTYPSASAKTEEYTKTSKSKKGFSLPWKKKKQLEGYPLYSEVFDKDVSELKRQPDAPEKNLFDTISFQSDSEDSGLGADSGINFKKKGLICIPKSKKSKKTKTSEIEKINYTEVQANRNKKVKRARLFSFSKDYPEIGGEIYEGELKELKPIQEAKFTNLFDEINFAPDEQSVETVKQENVTKSKSTGFWCVPTSKQSKRTPSIASVKSEKIVDSKIIEKTETYSLSKYYPEVGQSYEGELSEIAPIKDVQHQNIFDAINFRPKEEKIAIVETEKQPQIVTKEKSKSTGLWCMPTGKKQKRTTSVTSIQFEKETVDTKIIEKTETYSLSKYYPEVGQIYEGELKENAPIKDVQHQNIFDAINFRPKEEKIEKSETEKEQQHTIVEEKSKSSGLWCGSGSNKRKTSSVSLKSDESIKKGTLQALQIARNRIVQKARTFSMSENYPNQGETFEGELFELSPAVQAPSTNLFDSISFDDDPPPVIFTLESMATLNKETLPRERPNYLLACLTCGTKKFNHYPAITEPYRGEILPLEKSGEMQKNEMSEFVSLPIKINEKQEEEQKPVLHEKIENQQRAYSEYPENTEPFTGQLNTIYQQENIHSTNMSEYVSFENGSKQLDDRLEPAERVVTTETTWTVQEASPVKSERDDFVYKSSIEEQTHTSSASETNVETFSGLPEVIVTEVSNLTLQSEIPKSEITEHICFSDTGEGSHRRISQVIAAQKHIIISDEAPEMISAIIIMDEPNIVGEISPASEMPSKNLFDTISFESGSDDSGVGADSGSKRKSGGLICIPKSKKSKKTKTSEIEKINYTEVQANRNKKVKRARLFSFSKDYPEIGGEIYEGELKELKPIQEAKFTNLFDEINFAPDEQSVETVKQENVTKSKTSGLWCVPTAKKQKRTTSIASVKSEEIVDTKINEKRETYSLSQYYPEVGVSYEGELSETAPAKDSAQINIFDSINFLPKEKKIEAVTIEKEPQIITQKERKSERNLWCGPISKKRTTSVTSEESIKKGTLNALQIARNKAVEKARTFSFSKDYPEIGSEIYEGELNELKPIQEAKFTNLFDEIDFERDEDDPVYKKRQPTKPIRLHGPGISFLWCAPKHHDYSSYPVDNKPYTGELKELKVVEEAPSANLFDCVSFASTDDVNQDLLLNGHVVSQPTLFEHQQPIIIEQESVTVPYGYPLPTEIYDGEIDTLKPQRDYDHINIYERIEQVPKGISYVPPARKPSFLDKIRRASFKETSNENISFEREVIREEIQHVQRSEPMTIPTIIEPEPVEVLEKTEETLTIEMPVKEEIYIVEEPIEPKDVSFQEQTMEIDLIKSGDVTYHNEVTIIPDLFVSEAVESDNIPETIEELKHYPIISEPFIGQLSTLNKIEEAPASHLFDEINFLIIDKQTEQPQTAVPKTSKQNKFLWCGGQRSESPELVKMSKTKTFRNRVRTFSMSKHYPEIALPYEGELIGLKPSTEAPSRNLFDEISFASAESTATANEREKQKGQKQSFWCVPTAKKQKRTTSIKVEEESVKNKIIEKTETYSLSKYYPEVGVSYEGELSEITPAKDSAQINIFDSINFLPKEDKIEIAKPEPQQPHTIVKEKSKSSGLWCGPISKKRTTSVTSEESIKKGTLNALQIARNKAVEKARTFSFSKDYPEIGVPTQEGKLNELSPVKQLQFTNLFDEINFAPDEQSVEIVKQENVTKSKTSGLWCVPTAKKQKRTISITSIKVEEESVKNKIIEKAETFSMSEYYPEVGQSYEGELSEIAPIKDVQHQNIFDAINFRPKQDEIKVVEQQKQLKPKKDTNLICMKKSKRKTSESSSVSSLSLQDHKNLNAMQIARNKIVRRTRYFSTSKHYPEIGTEIQEVEINELKPVKQAPFTNLFDEIDFASDNESVANVADKKSKVKTKNSANYFCGMKSKRKTSEVSNSSSGTSVSSLSIKDHKNLNAMQIARNKLVQRARYFSTSKHYPEIGGEVYESELKELKPVQQAQFTNLFDEIDFATDNDEIKEVKKVTTEKQPSKSLAACLTCTGRKTPKTAEEEPYEIESTEAVKSLDAPSSTDFENASTLVVIEKDLALQKSPEPNVDFGYPLITESYTGEISTLNLNREIEYSNLPIFERKEVMVVEDIPQEPSDELQTTENTISEESKWISGMPQFIQTESHHEIITTHHVTSESTTINEQFEHHEMPTKSFTSFEQVLSDYPQLTASYESKVDTLTKVNEVPSTEFEAYEKSTVKSTEYAETQNEPLIEEKEYETPTVYIEQIPVIFSTELKKETVPIKTISKRTKMLAEKKHYPLIGTSSEGHVSELQRKEDFKESNLFDTISFISDSDDSGLGADSGSKRKSGGLICIPKSKKSKKTKTSEIEKINYTEVQANRNKKVKRARLFSFSKDYPEIGGEIYEGELKELKPIQEAKFTNLFDEINFAPDEQSVETVKQENVTKSKTSGLWCVPTAKKQKRTTSIASVKSEEIVDTKIIETYSMSKYYPEVGVSYEGELSEITPAKDSAQINIFDSINFLPKEEKIEVVTIEKEPQIITQEMKTTRSLWCGPTSKKRTTSVTSEESIKKGTLNALQIARNKAVEKARTFSFSKDYPEIGGEIYEGELNELAPVKQPQFTNLFDEINFASDEQSVKIKVVKHQKQLKPKKDTNFICMKKSKRKTSESSSVSSLSLQDHKNLNAMQIARNKIVRRTRYFSTSKHYPEIGVPTEESELIELKPVEQAQFTNLFDEIDFASDEIENINVEKSKIFKAKKHKKSNLLCATKSKRKTSEVSSTSNGTSVSSISLKDHKNLNAMQIARNKIVRRARYFSTSKHYPEIGVPTEESELIELKPVEQAQFTNLFDEIDFASDEENVIVKTTEVKKSVVPSSNKLGLCAPFKTSKRYPESEEPYTGIVRDTSLKEEVESTDLFKCINFASSNEQQREEEDKVGRMQSEERQPRKQMATLYFRRNTKQLEGYPLISEAYAGEVINLLRRPELETTNLFDCVSFASESDDEIPISQSSNARDSSKKGSPDKPKKKQLRLFGKTRRSTSDKELDLTLYPKTEAYSGPLDETTKANEMNRENLRKYITIYHSGYSQPFFRHRFIREKHEGVEEIGEAPADYEIANFTADETTPMAPVSELEGLPLRSYAKYPIVSISESPRDMKRKFSKSKIIPESSSESSSQSESETDTVPSLKASKKKENEGFLSFFRNRLSAKQQQRKRTGYEGLMDKFAGTYDITPKGNEMLDQPILEHVLVYHNGNSTQQPIDSGFEDGANASETERAGTFKRTGKLFFDKFKLSRDSGDKTTTEEIDKSESLEPKRVILTGYENLNTEPFLGLHSLTVYKNEIGQQPLTSTIDSIPTVYFYEGDATLSPVPTETTVETKVSTLERIIKSKKPRKDSNFAYEFLSIEGPTVDTDKKDEINNLPIGEHVTVYHCGRSDVPTAEVPPEVYVYEKDPISESLQSLTATHVAEPQGSQIEHVTLVKNTTKRESLKPYPEPFTYEGPIESLERLSEAGKENLNEYVNIYHSGLSTDTSTITKKLVKQESKTEKQPRRSILSQYSFDTTPYEGAIEETSVKKELEHMPLQEHASMYHAGISEVQNLEDLEKREKQIRELSLVQRIMAMFKKRELQGYPSMGEEYIGPMDETNRAEDIEKSEIKNVTNIYHSGYSYDPKTSKVTLKRFAPKRRFRLNMNDYPKDSAPIDAVIYDLRATEDIPKTPSPVTLPPESLIFNGPPKERQQSKWYRFWFLRRRGEPQSDSSGLEPSMPIIVESMSHRITDTSASIIMGTTDRSLFTKGHWPVTDIDVDVMLKTITKCHCECEALIIEKSFETGIGGSIQLQQHHHHQKQTLNDTSFRMDNNCIMQTSNGTWLAKVTKKISTQMEQKTDNIEVSKKAELYEKEEKNELNDEVLQPSTSVVKEKEVEDEDEIEVSRNSNLYYSKWDCEPPYLWSSDTYNNLEELIDDDELNIISKESGELPLTHEKKELEFINSSVRDSEMFASIRRRLSEKLAKKEKKKDEKRLKKEEKERKKHASKSGGGASSGAAAGAHGSSTGGYASESSSSSASISDAEIEERHVVISKAIDGPVQTLKRGQELGDLDNIEEDIDNNNKKLVKMAPQTSMGASAVNNIEANSSGPYTPAKEKDGRVIREETVEQVYRISGTGHAPNLDPNDMSLQSTVDKCIRDTERMPRVQMVEANVLVKECEPLPHGISEGSAPHTTLHSWHETEDGPETITTEVDEHGNKITRTIKTQTTKHTIQKQTYQTYAVEDKDKPEQTIIQTKESTIPLGNKSVTRSPVVHTKSRTVAYEKGSEPHENIDPIGELVSTKTITTGNRTVEILTYKTEKDGVIETRVEHRVTIHSGDNIDHDAELAKALLEATEMSPDLIINRVEVEKQTQR